MLESFDDSFVPNPKTQSNLTNYVIATYTDSIDYYRPRLARVL
uniref:Uncharacterized protein n=1 Tax=Siphoviridae sp. ctRRO23 TaxID=2826334 RepID=A0A8S5LTE5_9CAUD|nr:MAG TPA: hypothetical protein [Siphoviridae sp. ctRRO23]